MKAILVIDMPKSCGDCLFREKVSPDDIKCWANGKTYEETFNSLMYAKKNECPLKPMPKKAPEIGKDKIYNTILEQEAYLDGNMDGWNQCLEELEK